MGISKAFLMTVRSLNIAHGWVIKWRIIIASLYDMVKSKGSI
jgi:hypothetical protein